MESTHLEQPSIFLGPRVLRPWVRATARLIDILLAGLLLGWIGMVVHPLWVHGRGTALILFLGLILWIPFEAFLLSRWGTTFGKAILNMQVCDQHGKKLTYSRAVFRAMWVWAAGLVVGIPLIAPDTEGKIVLALIFAAPALLYIYWRLYRKAATSWDDKLGFRVRYGRLGRMRLIVAAISIPFGVIMLDVLRETASETAYRHIVESIDRVRIEGSR